MLPRGCRGVPGKLVRVCMVFYSVPSWGGWWKYGTTVVSETRMYGVVSAGLRSAMGAAPVRSGIVSEHLVDNIRTL